MGWVVAGLPSTTGDTLTCHGVSCAFEAPWQQPQPRLVCLGWYHTCMHSAQRSCCVVGLVRMIGGVQSFTRLLLAAVNCES